jgi:hypothetical protein
MRNLAAQPRLLRMPATEEVADVLIRRVSASAAGHG